MRVLLICPSFEEETFIGVLGLVAPPIGLAYVAAALENDGHEVKIIDMLAEKKDKSRIRKDIMEFKPRVVGVYSTAFNKSIEVINIAKGVDAHVKTMTGGPHATLVPEELLLKNQSLDVIVCGEGEVTVSELIKAWESNRDIKTIKGIVFRKNGHIVRTPPRPLIQDLDSLPFPARHLLPMEKYHFFGGLKLGTIVSSRGCPYGCRYCSVPVMYGKKWRPHSPESVVDEMEHLDANYDLDFILFVDDNFDLDKERTERICDEIVERGLDVVWGIQSATVHPEEEHLAKMRDAGCRVISYTIEAASNRAIDTMERETNKEEMKKIIDSTTKMGMMVVAHVVLGLPGEDREDVAETIKLMKELAPHYALFYLPTPYPGTKFYESAKEMDIIKELDWGKYTTGNPIIETKMLSLEEAKELNRMAWKEFYFDPKIIKNNLRTTYKFIRDGDVKLKHIPTLLYHITRTGVHLFRL
ncbi:MAG: B12-binding domain-containing radical SAM protein [Methanocellales archaeon]|nr:B12-binding domain-containing radical SAM protein [Methanocellales archaeon]